MWWHCPPDTRFEILALVVWGRTRYFSVTEALHNIESLRVSGAEAYILLLWNFKTRQGFEASISDFPRRQLSCIHCTRAPAPILYVYVLGVLLKVNWKQFNLIKIIHLLRFVPYRFQNLFITLYYNSGSWVHRNVDHWRGALTLDTGDGQRSRREWPTPGILVIMSYPANTTQWFSVVIMLGQRRRRWASIITTMQTMGQHCNNNGSMYCVYWVEGSH